MTGQAPGYYRRQLGTAVLTVLNDGFLDLPASVLSIPAEVTQSLLQAAFRESPRSSINAFVLQGDGPAILIDAGGGTVCGPTCGRLPANLAAAGIDPASIGLVLLTHLHRDHVGGLLTPEGTRAFPNAELAFAAEEAACWLDGPLDAVPEPRRVFARAAREAVAPYPIRHLTGTEAAPGVTRVPLPGHTPGHSGFMLGQDTLLVWGDIMHLPAIQAPRPDAYVGFDIDPAAAVASRRSVLARAAADRLLVAGMHLDFPCLFHVARDGEGYRLIPEPWAA